MHDPVRHQRLSITLSVVLIGLLVPTVLPIPAREVSTSLLGSELSLTVSGLAGLAALLILILAAGIWSIQSPSDEPLLQRLTYWPAPAALLIISLIYQRRIAWWGYQLLWVGLAGGLLALLITVQQRSRRSDVHGAASRFILAVCVYVEALVLFNLLYGTRARSIISASGALLTAACLSLELLRHNPRASWRTWLYAALVGLMLGEVTWALNYWSVDARLGAGLLLLVFYTLTGISQQLFLERLTRRVALEYALLCTGGFTVLALSRLIAAA